MNNIISMFIDDELDIDEKIEFVERVHEDRIFKDESVQFLQMEKLLESEIVKSVPPVMVKKKKKMTFPKFAIGGFIATALAAAMIFILISIPSQEKVARSHRFVIFRPDVKSVDITGSFTNWQVMPMKRAGTAGYWELTLDIPEGDHRYTYILDGSEKIPDPTMLSYEKDDFGGKNTILHMEVRI